MENVNVMTAVSDTAVENTKPKHKWLTKGSRFAKKADRKSTRLNSSHNRESRMPSSA